MHLDHSVTIIETDDGDKAAIIKICGTIFYDLVPALRVEFDHTLRKHRRGGIIVDLVDLVKMDSSALLLLVAFSRDIKAASIELALVPSPSFKETMEKRNLTSFFKCFETVDEAQEALGLMS
jgi:anti-anti-sigma factor